MGCQIKMCFLFSFSIGSLRPGSEIYTSHKSTHKHTSGGRTHPGPGVCPHFKVITKKKLLQSNSTGELNREKLGWVMCNLKYTSSKESVYLWYSLPLTAEDFILMLYTHIPSRTHRAENQTGNLRGPKSSLLEPHWLHMLNKGVHFPAWFSVSLTF